MSFNPSKCSLLTVRRQDPSVTYFLGGQPIIKNNGHQYLVMEFGHNLSFTRHINSVVSKAQRTLAMLRRQLKTADTKTKLVAYCTLIRSGLEYG